ncbi:hypothetical protein, partial [Polaribacter butkevichii]|uniref:hypothetical protein n=1 Tax=Polaribacter butkevichii TaxID=218490 RepID=UPI001B80D5B2
MQFAPANATPKIAKEYVLPTLTSERTENLGKPSRTWKACVQQRIKKIAGKSQFTKVLADFLFGFYLLNLVFKTRNFSYTTTLQ